MIRKALINAALVNYLIIETPGSLVPQPDTSCGGLTKYAQLSKGKLDEVNKEFSSLKAKLAESEDHYIKAFNAVNDLRSESADSYRLYKTPSSTDEQKRVAIYDAQQNFRQVRDRKSSLESHISSVGYVRNLLLQRVATTSAIEKDIESIDSATKVLLQKH